jgi:hypothetical protein
VRRPEDLLADYLGGTVLVDSNVLLLYLIGKCDTRIIARFTRTQKYTVEDFELLSKILDRIFKKVVTTPNILTEVSNLATKLSESERRAFFAKMQTYIAVLDERYVSSRSASGDHNYLGLGLTDAAVLTLCPEALVLTDDLPLYSVIAKRGRDVLNFTHLRVAAGTLDRARR